jgi:beta-glucosidase
MRRRFTPESRVMGARTAAIVVLLGLAGLADHAAAQPAADAASDVFVEALIARMTVEEKVGQLSLFAPASAAPLANPEARRASEAQQLDDIRAGRVMGLFNGRGLESKRRAQQAAVNESRLGIPLLFGADVIHGFRTIFPVPLAEAASWEPALAERCARAAAVEASADGLRWTFAPMVDIARDARWGRGVEGAGEDVFLARQFAAARVRGFQGEDLARADTLLATPKHFAGYGAAEGGIDYNGAELSERTLREVYLPPFRAAIDAGALALMAGFHEIAGIPSNANAALLSGVLRDEWGFRGFTMSDYTADEELVAHGVAADARAAAKLSFLAGTDVSMQSGLYMRYLPELVASGEVPIARLDAAVRRVLTVKRRLGLFEQPFRGLDGAPLPAAAELEHRALARDAARRAIVLLKNDGELLPLRKRGTRIALVGPFGSGPGDLLGPWSLFPGPTPPVGIAQALRETLGPRAALRVVRGSGVDAPLRGGIRAAVAAARQSDVVLLAIGESEAMSGEARSRSDIRIPKAQQDLAEAVAATGKPVIVLLRNGRALALEGAVRRARAILVTWFLGAQAGPSIADILFGDASPSGRLPVSFPQTPGQVPYHYSHKRSGRPTPEAQPDAFYKTRYLDASHAALYPFGHGLGYARVRYEALVLDQDRLAWDGTLTVRAHLRNEGKREVDEVAQLYVSQRAASVTRPVRELKGFRKLRIAPGESVEVAFTLARADLGFIGRDLKETVEPGAFDLWVGPSAAGGLRSSFTLAPR